MENYIQTWLYIENNDEQGKGVCKEMNMILDLISMV